MPYSRRHVQFPDTSRTAGHAFRTRSERPHRYGRPVLDDALDGIRLASHRAWQVSEVRGRTADGSVTVVYRIQDAS